MFATDTPAIVASRKSRLRSEAGEGAEAWSEAWESDVDISSGLSGGRATHGIRASRSYRSAPDRADRAQRALSARPRRDQRAIGRAQSISTPSRSKNG